ncbi:MAG: hypothetical protein ACHQ17_03200 [Polyangia bacterium]
MRLHQMIAPGPVRAGALFFGLAAALLAVGCDAPKQGCRLDSDCPGGACVVGECRTVAGVDLGLGGGDGATANVDLATPVPDGWSPDALAASCNFNGDGVIERGEEPFEVGLGALFAVNPSGMTVPVNNVPQAGVWDFSAPVSGEHETFDQLVSPSGAWWAGDFPTASYAERLDDGQALDGVYRITPTELDLLGVVSDQGGAQETELTYATPIVMLKFPLQVGEQWTSDSNVSGLASGVAFFAQEKWVFSVDLRGTTKVPAGSFDTLRVRMGYTQTYGLLVTTRIIYLHVAECYGAVARVRSQDNETSSDFTQAAEYRRLAP